MKKYFSLSLFASILFLAACNSTSSSTELSPESASTEGEQLLTKAEYGYFVTLPEGWIEEERDAELVHTDILVDQENTEYILAIEYDKSSSERPSSDEELKSQNSTYLQTVTGGDYELISEEASFVFDKKAYSTTYNSSYTSEDGVLHERTTILTNFWFNNHAYLIQMISPKGADPYGESMQKLQASRASILPFYFVD